METGCARRCKDAKDGDRPPVIFIPGRETARGTERLKRRLRESCLKSSAVAFNAIGAHLKIPSKMYSEISLRVPASLSRGSPASPLLPRLTTPGPSLKPSPRLFLRPCRFCLSIHPLLDRHPHRYLPFYSRTRAHTLSRSADLSLFLALSSSLPSLQCV